ncbi:MAG: hypothetical protein WCH83_01400 [Alphaproteobacteria bacterium]
MVRVRFAFAVSLLALAASAPAAQAQQGDGTLFRDIFSSIGLVEREKPPIEYRERAPLVLPPTRNLPAPQDAASTRNPAWPNDPDVARARRSQDLGNLPITRTEASETRGLTNRELREGNGGLFGGGAVDMTRAQSEQQIGTPLRAHEMGVRPIGQTVGSMFGGVTRDNEVIPFNGEPPRRRLVEPPPGMRTPSPDAPYGPVGRRPDDPNSAANRPADPGNPNTGRR